MFETRRRSWAKARLRDGNGAIDAKEGLGAIVPLRASRAALQQAFLSPSSLMRMLPCGPIRVRKSISVTNEVRVELYHQAQYNQCVTIIDLRALRGRAGSWVEPAGRDPQNGGPAGTKPGMVPQSGCI